MNKNQTAMECQNCKKMTLRKVNSQKYCTPCNGIVNRRRYMEMKTKNEN